MPALELFKDRNKWSLALAGLFIAAVAVTTGWLYVLSKPLLVREETTAFLTAVYGGLALIVSSGGLALWFSNTSQRESDAVLERRDAKNIIAPSHELQRQGTTETKSNAAELINLYAQEIHHQNRKITESIRYAKRIQGAILPSSRVIDRVLPDSFILYKPRDVVSGDFPWFAQVKNDIFMAAVDCTGHGVPGALLSLVGYFLLNDIVRSRRITETGRILDLLDEGVSATLRPDDELGSKDGMDISLCKIDVERRTVEYSGAHRPLYFVREGTLEEIKGDKFPIGGGIYKNQTNFTSRKLQFKSGDTIFFCSDGFCDQFGGPLGRKMGSRQLKQIIQRVHSMPMKEAGKVFDEAWESWKGNQKQTDDVLLIGIKFR